MTKGLFDLTGKVAVVTGGNSGIGLSFARGIAKQGGDVAIWSRSPEKNAAAKKELEAFGVRVETRPVDIASEDDVCAAFEAHIKQFGRVDCVIANAGAPPPRTPSTLEQSSKVYHDFLSVGMHGAMYTLREAARHMVKRAEGGELGGSLIYCGSLTIDHGMARMIPYAASKAAGAAMIRCMAVEFGKYGIRANIIAPGYIKTAMTGGDNKELSEVDNYFLSGTPMERLGYPKDFEAIAAYLASDASSFHSGDTIVIDGAYTAKL